MSENKEIVLREKKGKKKKIIIGSVVGVVVIAAVAATLYFTGVFEGKPYDYDLTEYITLGEYKGMEYDKVSVSVTDDEVTEEINSRLTSAATTEAATTGTVEDGDTINIAFEGKIDGKTFDGGSSDSYDLTIGQTSMIDGFTDGLIGMNVGDTKELNLTFPDDYNDEDVAGKDVVFSVTVNTKNVTTTPEYNLDFVTANSDYDTLEDYEASVKEDLLTEKTQDAEATVKDTLWASILDGCEVKSYPEKELNDEIDAYKAQAETYAESYGVDLTEFIETYMQQTEDEFNEQAKTYAENTVKSKMVMYLIAEKEGIEIDDDEFGDYLQNLLTEAGFTDDTFKDAYGESIEDYAEENSFDYYYLLNKVIDKVMEYGTEK